MSISPPSDIVLDVARAAEPTRYRQAVARLTAAAPAEPFSETLTDVALREPAPTPKRASAAEADAPATQATDKTAARADKTLKTYRAFEAMALANMLQSAMTSSTSFFGEGVAGDTWKSMMVDQIAEQMAKAGGVGIADQLAKSVKLAAAEPSPGAPAAAHSLLTAPGERALIRALGTEGDETTG